MFLVDYDRTITDQHLRVDETCISMIGKLRTIGVHTSVITGRKRSFMDSFLERYEEAFDSVICENGCIAYLDSEWRTLADFPSNSLIIERFTEEGIEFDHGDCIISTEALSEDEAAAMLSDIPDWHPIVNVDSVMILPPNVDKGTGIQWLKSRRKISKEEIAGIGDGENDFVMRDQCGVFGVPASAVQALKDSADFISREGYSLGTRSYIKFLLANYIPRNQNQN